MSDDSTAKDREPRRPNSCSDERRPRGAGWRQLRREREEDYKINFKPIQKVIRRGELLSSVVELFFSALAGVSKIQLGAPAGKEAPPTLTPKRSADGKLPPEDPNSDAEPPTPLV